MRDEGRRMRYEEGGVRGIVGWLREERCGVQVRYEGEGVWDEGGMVSEEEREVWEQL